MPTAIKLSLPVDRDLEALTQLVLRHGAHLSRNALRRPSDGREERFVRQRARLIGRPTAARHDRHAMLEHVDDRPNITYRLEPDFPLHWTIDWENFQKEYPQVPGTAADRQRKLTDALRPMFEAKAD